MKKNFLTRQQVFIYLALALFYALGVFFFGVLLFGIDLCDTDSGLMVSCYSLITASIWAYFICQRLK
jgi:hypothetical protein